MGVPTHESKFGGKQKKRKIKDNWEINPRHLLVLMEAKSQEKTSTAVW